MRQFSAQFIAAFLPLPRLNCQQFVYQDPSNFLVCMSEGKKAMNNSVWDTLLHRDKIFDPLYFNFVQLSTAAQYQGAADPRPGCLSWKSDQHRSVLPCKLSLEVTQWMKENSRTGLSKARLILFYIPCHWKLSLTGVSSSSTGFL